MFFISLLNILFAMQNAYATNWAEQTLTQLTLRQKIGQLFMVAAASEFDQREERLQVVMQNCPYRMDQQYIEYLISEYNVGGIIFLFKSTPDKQIDLTNHYQSISRLPLLIGQDCEWGLAMRLYDTVCYPRNKQLSSIADLELIYKLGYEIGCQCKAMGIHINFAPVVDVNNNPANPIIGDRSFGADKELVAEYGTLIMRGLQDAGIVACAKHFPGHGDVTVDSHFDLPKINHTCERLHEVELYPFEKLIIQGVKAVMIAHLEIPALEPENLLPATLSKKIVIDLLRNELGFNGLVVTDALGMQGVLKHFTPGDVAVKALQAGCDLLLCPTDVPAAVIAIEKAIDYGILSIEEIDHRVLKLLKIKEFMHIQQERLINKEQALQRINSPIAHNLLKQISNQINASSIR